MTKQEEVREDKIAKIDGWLKGYLLELILFVSQHKSLHMIDASWYDREIKRIKEALHSQGVVIKVTQKYPLQPHFIYEPLIKET